MWFFALPALASPQITVEALVVDACDASGIDQPVIDRTGPSMRLLRTAVRQLRDVEIVSSPYLSAPELHPMEFTVENGANSLVLDVTASVEEAGVRMDLEVERNGSDGLSNAMWRDLLVPEGSLLMVAGPGCTLLYVVPHAGEDGIAMLRLADEATADVARHFEGLSAKAARRRASELLAVSPATSPLL